MKSTLLAELEKEVMVQDCLPEPGSVSWVIDGMAIIQMISSLGVFIFDQLSETILQLVLKPFKNDKCFRVDVFYRYDFPNAVKVFEHAKQQTVDAIEMCILGASTQLPKDWKRFLGSSKNKAVLTSFFCNASCSLAPKALEPNQVLILAGGFSDGKVVKAIKRTGFTCLNHLFSTQEEADMRILLHAEDASHSTSSIVVWSPDTDVAVFCIHYVRDFNVYVSLWFRTSVKDKGRFIPIHDVAQAWNRNVSVASWSSCFDWM